MKDLYFNYIGNEEKAEILKHLNMGEAVRVGSTCIGHTRAEMVDYQAKEFFKEVGAIPCDKGYYKLR